MDPQPRRDPQLVRAGGGEPACGVCLELAEAADGMARYRLVYEAARHGGEGSCGERARSRLRELRADRPPAGELAAIDRQLGLTVPECAVEGLETHAGPRGARVVAQLVGECDLTSEEVAEPRQFVVRGEGLRPGAAPAEVAIDAGGAGRVRIESGAVRVDLTPEAQARMFRLGDRVMIDVVPEPEIGARAEGVDALIVLDPGHGGPNNIGGSAGDLVESTLVLDIAVRVQRRLARRLPNASVVLTRTDDTPLGLDERTAMANSLGADLFVSLHLNASDDPIQTGGVTTFVLDATTDRAALQLAARENGTREHEVTGIQRLIARLHRREQVGDSRELAQALHDHTLEAGRRVLPDLADRGVRSAMFYVLVGARMPAVLLEASFLSNPAEARALRTERYREALADGIAEGLVRYLSENSGNSGD